MWRWFFFSLLSRCRLSPNLSTVWWPITKVECRVQVQLYIQMLLLNCIETCSRRPFHVLRNRFYSFICAHGIYRWLWSAITLFVEHEKVEEKRVLETWNHGAKDGCVQWEWVISEKMYRRILAGIFPIQNSRYEQCIQFTWNEMFEHQHAHIPLLSIRANATVFSSTIISQKKKKKHAPIRTNGWQ